MVVRLISAVFACALSIGAIGAASDPSVDQLHVLNRVTWGVNSSLLRHVSTIGIERYLEQQLGGDMRPRLPPAVQGEIDALTISRRPISELVPELDRQFRSALEIKDLQKRVAAVEAYQDEQSRLANEAASRAILRSLYSPTQLVEHMTWFWMNHFNVYQYRAHVRPMVGDYEEQAIRPYTLGRFRVLLGATAHHPAMLAYLDNGANEVGRMNENYARELMELHTLGVAGGYTQRDVQELARILTGVGLTLTGTKAKVSAERESAYVLRGLFEYNPDRHDYGQKTFLGQTIKGTGLAELDQALDLLARHPATARLVSRKLAQFFVSDDPPADLIKRMSTTFQATDGDIAAILRVMFASAEFKASLGSKFKDPVHYVLSAVRLAYEDKAIANPTQITIWLQTMGEALYNHGTPDGYPLMQAAWTSPGQLMSRFAMARTIGAASGRLFTRPGSPAHADPLPALLSTSLCSQIFQKTMKPRTLNELMKAKVSEEWNTLFLSSPEFMYR